MWKHVTGSVIAAGLALIGGCADPAPPPDPGQFARVIEPILVQNCAAAACHDWHSVLDVTSYAAVSTYGEQLLDKATGQLAHAGGRGLDPGSDAYAELAAWVAAGSPE